MAKAEVTKKTSSTKTVKPSVAKAVGGKAAKKSAPKKVIAEPKAAAEKATVKVQSTLKINVVDTEGKEAGSITLPEAVFGAKVNKALMSQAVRVYLANQRLGTASTKTRGEVDGSTRKIYRQKGTGRARHGGIRAPIFVKGGIAHGPKPHDFGLSLPTKMKRAALFSALSAQMKNGNVVVVAGLEKVGAKTKPMASALTKVAPSARSGQAGLLVVMPEVVESVFKSARNIQGITLTPAAQLNTYVVLQAKKLVFMKDAIESLEKTFVTSSTGSASSQQTRSGQKEK